MQRAWLTLRTDPDDDLRTAARLGAAAEGTSLNSFVLTAIRERAKRSLEQLRAELERREAEEAEG